MRTDGINPRFDVTRFLSSISHEQWCRYLSTAIAVAIAATAAADAVADVTYALLRLQRAFVQHTACHPPLQYVHL